MNKKICITSKAFNTEKYQRKTRHLIRHGDELGGLFFNFMIIEKSKKKKK